MTENYQLGAAEVRLYEGSAVIGKNKKPSEVLLTNENIVFITPGKSKKDEPLIEVHPIAEVKVYQGKPQIIQSMCKVEVFFVNAVVELMFDTIFAPGKFIGEANKLITGMGIVERGATAVNGAIGVVNTALGINTVETAKDIIQNGVGGVANGVANGVATGITAIGNLFGKKKSTK